MDNQYSRTVQLIGEETFAKLRGAHAAVFGLGGVGSFAAEALCRAGVGTLTLCDGDAVQLSNLNRQLFALRSTVGKNKAEAAAARLADIDPETTLIVRAEFFRAGPSSFDFSAYDVVIDAIDSVPDKTELIARAKAAGVPVVSCMGTGNKLDPAGFEVAQLKDTSVCPLAKVMRKKLKERGITELTVVYSKEPPAQAVLNANGRPVPSSISFVPSAAGLLCAAEAVRMLMGDQ